MGCIPLGTGNDSSRAFGWGFKFGGKKHLRKSVELMRVCTTFVKWDRWHSFAQYDAPVTDSFAEHLPASLRPVRSKNDLPDFFRHPRHVSLPPVPSEKNAKLLPPSDSLPRPHRAVTIDADARAEGYNVQAVSLSKREDPDSSPPANLEPVPLFPASSASAAASGSAVPAYGAAAPSPEAGPGFTFGGQFNNYLSWGVDAQIQNQFHVNREACRACFCCRPCNMAWMGCFGFTNFMTCASSVLDASVEVRDEQGHWVDVPLPPSIRSIVLLNTPTYGGGRRLWGLDNPRKPKPKPREWECESQSQQLDDGLFEIVGVRSAIHLGLVMGFMSRGVRIAQVNEARLTFRSPVHAQADGQTLTHTARTQSVRVA